MLKSRPIAIKHLGQKSITLKTQSWVRLALILGLVTSGNTLYVLPLIAASPAGGTTIDNQATGTFIDGDDLTNTEEGVVSNIVTLTVAEVAGITVGAAIPVDAPSNVAGAGLYQNAPGIHTGDVAYFDFTITNIGNDPTKFVIPSTATVTGGGIVGQLQIIGYDSLVFDGVGSNPAPVNVPTTFAAATNSTGALLSTIPGANSGSVSAGGTIKVRVPVTITASAGTTVTVLLGNTPVNPASTPIAPIPPDRLQNQAYTSNGNADIYTLDNNDPPTPLPAAGTNEVTGSPVNGIREASAIGYVTVLGNDIGGNVFEDINYGGGAGRSKTASGGVGVDGARVELYDRTGKFIRSTLTASSGNYTFLGVPAGDFYIRTVNSTVKSTRSATNTGLLPVQTFLTNAGVTAGNVNPILNKVGGETPSQVDAGSSGTGAVLDPATGKFTVAGGSVVVGEYIQSLTKVKVANAQVTGLDFGYNFDTIVNTNNAGQGSLRQFILNSNTLPNTSLNQVGQTAGKEVSIFMIPNGTSNAGQQAGLLNQVAGTANNNGAAVITLASPLDAVTDSNTTISGFTQTTNIGNSNAGQVGSGVGVGISNQAVAKTDRPEIVIDGRNLIDSTNADQYAITLNADFAILKGIAVYGTKGNYSTAAGGDSGAVRVGSTNGSNVSPAGAAIIEQNLIGTFADGSDPGASLQNQRYGTICFAACEIKNNFIAYNGYGTLLYGAGANGSKIIGNEYQSNGPNAAPNSPQKSAEGDSVALWSASNAFVENNLIANTRGVSSNTLDSGKGIELVSTLVAPTSGNQIKNNTIEGSSTAGIGLYNNAIGNTIFRNIIHGTTPVSTGTNYVGAGILLSASSSVLPATTSITPIQNTISENSIYGNSGLGIDIDPRSWLLGDGVTANNGGTAPAIPNIGLDYPVITSSRISSGTLTVKGYVGNQPNGSSTFAGAKLEFFVADNSPANQNGEVLLGDGKNKSHGEGRTYIGTCDALGDSTFDCSFAVSITDAVAITAIATLNGNTSEFSSVLLNIPNVLLVKRITNVNGSTSTLNGQNLSSYYDEPSNPYDDNTLTVPAIIPPDTNQWPDPATFLIGGTDGGNVRPGDMVEYTIYFLSNGEGVANNVSICDLIPDKQTFVLSIAQWTGAAAVPSATGGNIGADRGIVAQINDQPLAYTNLTDSDKARYYPPGTTLPNACRKSPLDPIYTNINGAVVVDLGTIVNPINSTLTEKPAGFMRFRTRVN